MRRPWFKFWPADWRGDPKLRACSLIARAVWIELLCVMHEGSPYGHCAIGGALLTVKEIAALVGAPLPQVGTALAELERRGVLSRSAEGAIYSRRMVRDEAQREEGKRNGKRGGSPVLAAKSYGGGIRGGDKGAPKGGSKDPPQPRAEHMASSGSSGSSLTDSLLANARSEGASAPGLPGIDLRPPKGKREPTQGQVDGFVARNVWRRAWLAKFGVACSSPRDKQSAALRYAFVRLGRDEARFREVCEKFLSSPPFKARQNPTPAALHEHLDAIVAGLIDTGHASAKPTTAERIERGQEELLRTL